MRSTKMPSETTWKEWLLLLLLHCVFLAVVSMTVGLLLEAALGHFWTDTILEPFAPLMALVALFSGYFVVSRGQSHHAATWTWTFGIVWLAFGIYDTTRGWEASWSPEKTHWAYAFANLFAPPSRCSATE
jgi:hypothetical protein